MSVTLVQQKAANNAVVTLDAPPTPGNSLILVAAIENGAGSGVTGGGVTWARATGAGVVPEIWYGHNSDGLSSAVTISGARGFAAAADLTEWSGLTNAASDATNNSTGTSTTPGTGAVTTVHQASLLIAGGQWTADDYSSGPGSSFSRLTPVHTPLSVFFAEEAYRVVSSIASYSTAWVLSAGIAWSGSIAAFQAPTPGPTPAQSSAGFFM